MKLWRLFFWSFKDCLKIFVMFVNVDMCKTVLIAGESTGSAAIFIELLKFFCEVLTIIFRMHVYGWWRIRAQLARRRGGGASPTFFWKLKKLP